MKACFLRLVYVSAVLLGGLASSALAETFSDGFEGPQLSAFWTKTGVGSAAISNAAAHSGAQSLLMSNSATFPYAATVSHDFGSDRTGVASVWFHSNLCCNANGDINIRNSTGDWANIQQFSNGVFQTRVTLGGIESPLEVFTPPADWHLLELRADSAGLKLVLDGAIVRTNPAIKSFRYVALDVWGGPAGGGFFDDFNANLNLAYSICPQYDFTKPAKGSATVPIKLQLCNSAAANLSSSARTLHAIDVLLLSSSSSFPAQDSGNANPNNDFRYAGGFYIYNLSTKGLRRGAYYLRFTVNGDPSVYVAPFLVE